MRALITMIAILTVGIASAQSAVSTTTTEGITLSVSGAPGSIELSISGSSNVNQNGTFQVPRRAPSFLSPLYASGSIADQAKLSGAVTGGNLIGGTVSLTETGATVTLDLAPPADAFEADEYIVYYRGANGALLELGSDDFLISATDNPLVINIEGADFPSEVAFLFGF